MKIILVIFFLLHFIIYSHALENKIVLKLDNEVITTIDIENEKNYLIALNVEIKNLDETKLNEISKNSLIREKIKEKEILKYVDTIELKQEFLDQLIQQRYSRLNLKNREEFLNYLKDFNLELKSIENKISIEAVWNQLIYQKFYKNVKIDKKKLEEQVIKKNKEKEKNLLLSEIVFQISNKNNLNLKYIEILEDINKKGFESAALIHSISDSSSLGGKLGWIKQRSLNNIIRKEIKNLKKSEITKPIYTPNGYLILQIDEIKYEKIKFNKNYEINELIKSITNQQLNQHSIIYFNKIKKIQI